MNESYVNLYCAVPVWVGIEGSGDVYRADGRSLLGMKAGSFRYRYSIIPLLKYRR